jgi:hypothetical protein
VVPCFSQQPFANDGGASFATGKGIKPQCAWVPKTKRPGLACRRLLMRLFNYLRSTNMARQTAGPTLCAV